MCATGLLYKGKRAKRKNAAFSLGLSLEVTVSTGWLRADEEWIYDVAIHGGGAMTIGERSRTFTMAEKTCERTGRHPKVLSADAVA